MDNTTVKMDRNLLSRIEKLLRIKSKKIKYVNRKHFTDIAVLELLEREEGKDETKQNSKS